MELNIKYLKNFGLHHKKKKKKGDLHVCKYSFSRNFSVLKKQSSSAKLSKKLMLKLKVKHGSKQTAGGGEQQCFRGGLQSVQGVLTSFALYFLHLCLYTYKGVDQ